MTSQSLNSRGQLRLRSGSSPSLARPMPPTWSWKSRRHPRADGTAPARHLVRPLCRCHVGYGFSGQTKVEDSRPSASTPTVSSLGGFVGYNCQAGNFVATAPKPISATAGVKGDNGRIELQVGRRRLAARPSRLRGHPGHPALCAPPVAPPRTSKSRAGGVSDSNTMLGWTAGVGADIKITEQVFGRVEYRYTDFGSDNFGSGSAPTSATRKTASLSASA